VNISDKDIPSLKVGDVIYECEAGMNIEARVTEAPTETGYVDGRKQWQWKAVNTQCGEEINYLLTEGLSHYGPRLYRNPQYCRFSEGEMTFPLFGAPSQVVAA
jgi:hypothetical protein